MQKTPTVIFIGRFYKFSLSYFEDILEIKVLVKEGCAR